MEFMRGFWSWDIANQWPPLPITYFEDFVPKPRLNLDITQLMVRPQEQKKIVQKWCAELPNLNAVEYLWFTSRVSQEMFEVACQMENLKGLFIKWSGIKNIDSIVKLKHLKHLHIGSSSQIENIKVFININSLETLELENIKKVQDFSDLAGMTNLVELGIDGGMWQAQKIQSLKPIENLVNLKRLSLTNTQILDGSFDPILKLKNLVGFYCSWNNPVSEFEKLKTLPNLKYGNIETSWEEEKRRLRGK